MTSVAHSQSSSTDLTTGTTVAVRPSRKRRTALAVVGVLACALPVVFTFNITRMLATGELADHRFHQLTGQGEILFALWLWPILAMLLAGWQGRRPGAWAGYLHLALIAGGIVCAALAPGGGAPFLVGVITITGALLWATLPQRPRLRHRVGIDPLLAPLALIGSALLLPYAIDQVGLQNAATGHHAHNPHFFDQAWIAVTMSVMAVAAAAVPGVRGLARWFAGSLVVLGVTGLALGETALLFSGFLALGIVVALADAATRHRLAAN